MLAHADFRHGRISRLRGKVRVVQGERFIQRLLGQLKVFHIARFPGALKECGSQGRVRSRILGIALHPGLHGLNHALGAGGAGDQQGGRHGREDHWRDGCRGHGLFDTRPALGLRRRRRVRGLCHRRAKRAHASAVGGCLRIPRKEFVGALQHPAGRVQFSGFDVNGCDVICDGGKLGSFVG